MGNYGLIQHRYLLFLVSLLRSSSLDLGSCRILELCPLGAEDLTDQLSEGGDGPVSSE